MPIQTRKHFGTTSVEEEEVGSLTHMGAIQELVVISAQWGRDQSSAWRQRKN